MARVRSKANALGRLLAASPSPVYAMDEQRRIVYCNAACGDLLGLDPTELIGQRCDYHTTRHGTTPADIAASLCPPPEVFSGTSTSATLSLLHASGKLLNGCGEYWPLGDDELHCVGVLAIVRVLGRGDKHRATEDSESVELHRRLANLRREILADHAVEELIGVSPAIRRVSEQIDLASRGRTRVLVLGPGGSGREHVARLIHTRATPDLLGPLVPLACPLLDAELLQTTITALARKFTVPTDDQRATHGSAPTLLLLEADQLLDEAQAELAGFLALPGFELYCVATAAESLLSMAHQGRFRADLAHAMSTLIIEMPSLADRSEDIPLLCQYFLEKSNSEGGRQLSGFTPDALDELLAYTWPDNVDELGEVVDRACRVADGPFVERSDLPDEMRWAAHVEAHPRRRDEPIVLDDYLADIEKELIARAVRASKGNKTKAAKLLGLSRARLHRRLNHFGFS